MKVMGHDKWDKLHAGDYTVTTWNGDSQLTYRAIRQDVGWVSRKVAGAGLLILSDPPKTLRDAQSVAKDDSRRICKSLAGLE